MKKKELLKVLEDFKSSNIKAKFEKMETIDDAYNYDEVKTIGKVVISVESKPSKFQDSINDFVNIISSVYNYFSEYERLSEYVRKPFILINGEVDDLVDMRVSDFDCFGFVDIAFTKGLTFDDHLNNKYDNISFKSSVVIMIEID